MTPAEIMALEPGTALDARVAELVMGMQGPFDICCTSGMGVHDGEKVAKRYSTDMALAWEVVEAVRERKDADGFHRWYFQLRDQAIPETPWVATFLYRGDEVRARAHEARGYTAPRAICYAALLAVNA